MLHCDLRLRWKVASDLRFRAAISEPKTSSFCGISGDLAQSTRKSLAMAIVRFWCTKIVTLHPKKGRLCTQVCVGYLHIQPEHTKKGPDLKSKQHLIPRPRKVLDLNPRVQLGSSCSSLPWGNLSIKPKIGSGATVPSWALVPQP